MSRDQFVTVTALMAASVVVTALLWLATSGVVSFVAMDWRASTSSPMGRAVFAVLWVWLHALMVREEKR